MLACGDQDTDIDKIAIKFNFGYQRDIHDKKTIFETIEKIKQLCSKCFDSLQEQDE